MLARPFAALHPRAETAADVIAPPYDVVDTDEARALAAGRPASFLHISRPEIDLPEGTDPHSAAVYATGAGNLARLVADGVLVRDSAPGYYVYRMRMGEHSQTGIAFAASVRAYDEGRIHRHELTRPDKEDDRVRNIDALNAQTGPVLLAYKADRAVDNSGIQNLPRIESCQECHTPAVVSNACVTCHRFHPDTGRRSELRLSIQPAPDASETGP